jgi:hypothetical protein
VVDADKQLLRSVVDAYMESGDSFLFDEQVISITSQSREHSYSLIIEAIKRAVQASHKLTAATVEAATAGVTATEATQSKSDRAHELDDDRQIEQLSVALRAKFGTAKAAFDSFSYEGTIDKRAWKRMLKKMLPTIPKATAKALRKKLPNKVRFEQFRQLMDKVQPMAEQAHTIGSASHSSSHLAQLPSDVPVLPTSFKSRPHAQEQLVTALLDSGGSRSTAVTAPKSRISSQGMGGVGKTMLTAAVVRDKRVRGAFESIAWIGMSQQPELLQLQAKLYQQLHPENEKMPSKADSVESRIRELVSLCSHRAVLVCLDDICKY